MKRYNTHNDVESGELHKALPQAPFARLAKFDGDKVPPGDAKLE